MSDRPTVHVVGAGLAGLSAAVSLDPRRFDVVLHETARRAGGRCRSYFDATLGMTIDNGNHLVLSGNRDAMAFCRTIGSSDKLVGPAEAAFDFADLASGARWRVRPNAGPIPWWLFVADRRVPGTGPLDYLALARLMTARRGQTVGDVMRCEGPLWDRLWRPFLVAAMNTEPKTSSARLAGAVVRESLAKGGAACRPMVAVDGLSEAFVTPALAHLARVGATVRFDGRLRAIAYDGPRATSLDFGEDTVALGPDDRIILALPAPVATALVPGLVAPRAFRAIVNAHFKIDPPAGLPPLTGVIGGTMEWLFAFPDRLSVTVSDADHLLDTPRETLAATFWEEIKRLTGIAGEAPPWQIIREKRATFAATPECDARRPGPRTAYTNVGLAGDWTDTGLPSTIEGAIRSGRRAAEAAAA